MRHLGILMLGFLLTACGGVTSTPAANPAVTVIKPSATALPSATSVRAAELAATATATRTPATVVATPAAGGLTVKIISPEDNAVVTASQVEIKGESAPNAVISLNEVIAVADATGAFSATVPLVEGPNVIEVVASDADGNAAHLELIVTYDPGS